MYHPDQTGHDDTFAPVIEAAAEFRCRCKPWLQKPVITRKRKPAEQAIVVLQNDNSEAEQGRCRYFLYWEESGEMGSRSGSCGSPEAESHNAQAFSPTRG
jgi:hypothetical protein